MSTRASRTKDALLSKACEVLAANPGASLETIADAAGVGRATLHRHFGSRHGLIRELAWMAIRENDAAVATIPLDTSASDILLATLDAMVPLGDRFHFLSRELDVFAEEELAGQLKRQIHELEALVEALKSEGAIAPEVPTAWVVTTIDSLIYSAWHAVQEGHIAARDAPKLVYRTVLEGLGPRER